MTSGYIDFIPAPDFEAVTIGFGADPEQRLRQLNAARHEDREF